MKEKPPSFMGRQSLQSLCAAGERRQTTMKDRVVLMTGATSGIGRETAVELARRGAAVLAVSRDRARGEAAAEEIRRRSGSGSVELFLADLSSQASIRELARAVRARHDRLHVLVNNAGIINLRRRTTVDGLEETFAVNHLAPFLLTNLLLDRLSAGAPARIVNVASAAHKFGRVDFTDLQGEAAFKGLRAYADSKLDNVLFTYELARRLEERGLTGVTANCVHPGGVDTGIWRGMTGFLRLAMAAMRPFLLTPARGAEPLIHLASSPELSGVTGRYFHRMKPRRSSAASRDRALAARLWEASAALAPVS
jgi:NAD(P)-dependent dehydrogenase (short-subunit alcohol dehydrogenase family)